jgi:hypothetical protein
MHECRGSFWNASGGSPCDRAIDKVYDASEWQAAPWPPLAICWVQQLVRSLPELPAPALPRACHRSLPLPTQSIPPPRSAARVPDKLTPAPTRCVLPQLLA